MVDFNKHLNKEKQVATTAAKKSSKAIPLGTKSDAIEKRTQTTALSTQVVDLEAMAGAGAENVGQRDLAIPRIVILQSGSPQVKKGEGAYIKGAEEGDFLHSVLGQVFAKSEDGFMFIPVAYDPKIIEWVPKKQGGGLVAIHTISSGIERHATKDADNRLMLPNGHELVYTGEFFCIVAEPDGSSPQPASISMAKTQFVTAKQLNSQLNMLRFPSKKNPGKTFNPPYFASHFLVTSVPKSNDKGSWMVFKFDRQGNTEELAKETSTEILELANALYESVRAGTVKVADPVDGVADGGGGAPEDGATL
jgi:hypothetical protein